MNRIATAPVIRGNGACQAFIDGVLIKELERLDDKHAEELRKKDYELEYMTESRNRQLRKSLEADHAMAQKRIGLWERVCNMVNKAWCMLFAMALVYGFIEEVRDEE